MHRDLLCPTCVRFSRAAAAIYQSGRKWKDRLVSPIRTATVLEFPPTTIRLLLVFLVFSMASAYNISVAKTFRVINAMESELMSFNAVER